MVRAMYKVAVFARRPVIGQVKTRLTPALTPAMAASLYRALLADTLWAVSELDSFERHVFWTGDPAPLEGLPQGFTQHEQQGADLGERLERAFDALLTAPGDRVVIVGADCPAITGPLVRSAFASLATHPVVLGPASDGGYWLVGLRKRTPPLFRGIPWSTGAVMAQTLERAARSELTVGQLDMLDDLDTPGDLARLVAASFLREDTCGPRLHEALRDMALLPR